MAKKANGKSSSKQSIKKQPTDVAPSSTSESFNADRSDLRIPIHLLVDYKSEGHYLFDFCKDLGTGGVFIETQTPLSTGSELDLTFTLPDSKETVSTRAKVIWSQTPIAGRDDVNVGMGLQFTQFNDSQRKKLFDFVSRYSSGQTQTAQNRRVG